MKFRRSNLAAGYHSHLEICITFALCIGLSVLLDSQIEFLVSNSYAHLRPGKPYADAGRTGTVDHGWKPWQPTSSSTLEGVAANVLVLRPHACQVPSPGIPRNPTLIPSCSPASLHPFPGARQMPPRPRLPAGLWPHTSLRNCTLSKN